MTRSISPGTRRGIVAAPPSKSQLHRLLICAALSREPSVIPCSHPAADILATADCLGALGASVSHENGCFHVIPIGEAAHTPCILPCGESGSTLRFLLPVAGALGREAVFTMEGRLSLRPNNIYVNLLSAHGMTVRQDGNRLFSTGALTAGDYTIPGNISSQYISGLLMALPLLPGNSSLHITESLSSENYVNITAQTLRQSGIRLEGTADGFFIPGGQLPDTPALSIPEGDWSGAAFFLCMGALSPEGVSVRGLPPVTAQGDRRVLDILGNFGAVVSETGDSVTVRRGQLRGITVDADSIPDLIPPLCAVAAAAEGETHIVRAQRLRMKESDRLRGISLLLRELGGNVSETEDGLIIRGRPGLNGGHVDPMGDHRLAMTAAVGACVCSNAVTVINPTCVNKSYPRFWDDFDLLEAQT